MPLLLKGEWPPAGFGNIKLLSFLCEVIGSLSQPHTHPDTSCATHSTTFVKLSLVDICK